jgi:Ser/Thr protein kinase RdoA (MazF antagonist)
MLRAPGWGTPICYGAVARDRGARYWLLLERVPGPLLWQVGRFDAWLEAARWLARLHERGGFRSERLLPYDRKYYQSWLARAQDFLRQRKPPPARAVQSRFERLAGRYDRVVRRLLDWPATFIHGEFYPSNVIVRAGRKRNRICPIDWESAARGPGPVDLAALVSGDWSEDRKTAMISAYRRALRRRPPLAELVEVVDYCQLHLAMRSLGWARAWSPPAPHARDWLREALRLAEKLAI